MAHWATIYFISEWLIRLLMLLYVPQNRTPAAARTWLLVIFLVPWPGLVLYMVIGRVHLPKRRREMQERASRTIRSVQNQFERRGYAAEPQLPPHLSQGVKLAFNLGDFEPFGGNEIQLLDDYQGSIDRLIFDIDAAADHVHLLFYIWANDATGKRVAEACSRAARRGVAVRILMDDVGSKKGLRGLAPLMRLEGIEVASMLRVGFFLRGAARYDLRNHRKIAVIDGRIGYTGSQNIVDPSFVPGRPNEELVLRVVGPLVSQLQAVFLTDHYFETGQATTPEPRYFPQHPPVSADGIGAAIAQLLPSGPGYRYENGQEVIVALMHGARKRIVITTPYLIPDEPVLQAMWTAVLGGVEVRLIVSQKSNQVVTEFAQQSYYAELLEAGVSIHRYIPKFLHAKHVSIDDDVAIIGTSNMDIRSFKLNAEVVAIVYDRAVCARLREIQERYIANSETLTAEQWANRPTWRRLVQNVARMADALL